MTNEELLKRIVELQVHVEQLDERCTAHEEVLCWLLNRCEGDDASLFLSGQAEDLEAADLPNNPPKYAEIVATLDLLRERIAEQRVQQRDAQ